MSNFITNWYLSMELQWWCDRMYLKRLVCAKREMWIEGVNLQSTTHQLYEHKSPNQLNEFDWFTCARWCVLLSKISGQPHERTHQTVRMEPKCKWTRRLAASVPMKLDRRQVYMIEYIHRHLISSQTIETSSSREDLDSPRVASCSGDFERIGDGPVVAMQRLSLHTEGKAQMCQFYSSRIRAVRVGDTQLAGVVWMSCMTKRWWCPHNFIYRRSSVFFSLYLLISYQHSICTTRGIFFSVPPMESFLVSTRGIYVSVF
jgi:hypothetical protein